MGRSLCLFSFDEGFLYGLYEWVRYRQQRFSGGMAGIGPVVFLPLRGRQVDYWKDTETLYRQAVAIDPE